MKFLLLYMPVLHKGYLDFIRYVKPDVVGLLSEAVLQDLPEGLTYIAKKDSIRALFSEDMCRVVTLLFPEVRVLHLTAKELEVIPNESAIFMPDEDVSVEIEKKYLVGKESVTLVTPPSRLRYNRNNVEEKKLLVPTRRFSLSAVDREMMALAEDVSVRSPDWYRQVGGVLFTKSGQRIVAYNEHQPHDHVAATFGDPRSIFKSGVRTDISFGDHAEFVLIGEAARRQIGTEYSSAYLTTFPCLPCSRLLARAGVKKLFYRDPSYGLLDADEFLRIKKVELVEVYSD